MYSESRDFKGTYECLPTARRSSRKSHPVNTIAYREASIVGTAQRNGDPPVPSWMMRRTSAGDDTGIMVSPTISHPLAV